MSGHAGNGFGVKHGFARRGAIHPLFWTWSAMRKRCANPANKSYPLYGGRGITVCERWHSFENFLADMGERPPGMTLDRIDNDGNYEPGNCRWASASEQQNNRRSNTHLTVNGVTRNLVEWARLSGVDPQTIATRIKRFGWTHERAIFTPPRDASGRRRSHWITAHGRTLTLTEWARELGVSVGGIKWRLASGRSPEDALMVRPRAVNAEMSP